MLGIALLFRIVLLVAGRTPTDRWHDCLPLTRQKWHGVRAMLVFYLSLGRVPLPAWYGHNPLWGHCIYYCLRYSPWVSRPDF